MVQSGAPSIIALDLSFSESVYISSSLTESPQMTQYRSLNEPSWVKKTLPSFEKVSRPNADFKN